jgi:thioredoxin-related protein
MNHLYKRIELVANIAIILVAISLVVVLTKRFVFPARNQDQASNNIPSNVGSKLPQVDIDWSKSNKNVLLLLSTSCHFCTESAPFYKRLAQEQTQRGTFSLTAVLPQPVSEGQTYLNRLGVDINDIRQLSPAAIRIRGTPTILLVDAAGVVTDEWLGKLPQEKEDEVLSRLR